MSKADLLQLDHAIGYQGSVRGSFSVHPNDKNTICISGSCIVVGSTTNSHEQHFLRGHDDRITCMSLSKSGKLIVSGQFGANADVCIWNFETKQLIYRLAEHEQGVTQVSFSDDEKLVVSLGDVADRRMLIWDLSTGYIVASTSLPTNTPTIVQWGGFVLDIKRRPTSEYQIATASNKNIWIWHLNPKTGELSNYKINTGVVVRDYTVMYFSPAGDYLYLGSTTGDISVIHMRSKVVVATVPVCALGVTAMLPFQNYVIVGGGDGTITIFQQNPNSKDILEPIRKIKISDHGISSVSTSSFQDKIYIGTYGSENYVYPLSEKNNHVSLLSKNHRASVGKVTCLDDELFASVADDKTVRVWNLSKYEVKHMVEYKSLALPTSMCFMKGVEVILTGWGDGSIKAMDSVTGESIWQMPNAHKVGITALQASKNSKFFMTGDEQGEIRVWDLKSREVVSLFKEHKSAITQLQIFDNNSNFLSSSNDRSIFCWDLKKERRVATYNQKAGHVNDVSLSPTDQSIFVSVGSSKYISYWDTRAENAFDIVQYDKVYEPTCVSFNNKGNLLAIGGTDQNVNLFQMQTHLVKGEGHSGTVRNVQFTHDDKQVISAAADACLFIWNVFE